MEVGKRSLPPPLGAGATPSAAAGRRRGHAPGMQTEPQLEAVTSAGVIFPETGQLLLLCSLQLRQQLQHCHQTRARLQVFNAF